MEYTTNFSETLVEILKNSNQSVPIQRYRHNKVYCIMVKDDNPKFSSFCVPTNEAIGWGRSVWAITGYKWPKEIQDTTLDCTPTAGQEAINLAYTIKKTNKFDCIWIINKKYVKVIR